MNAVRSKQAPRRKSQVRITLTHLKVSRRRVVFHLGSSVAIAHNLKGFALIGNGFSVGTLTAGSGAGLGNEIFPWAKAYIGAAWSGRRLIDPPWRFNPRRYDREFAVGALASAPYLATRIAPRFTVDSTSLLQTGAVDYEEALAKLSAGPQGRALRGSVLLDHASGMTGGYLGIRKARGFLRSRLLGGPYHTSIGDWPLEPSTHTGGGACLRVAVHVRMGDFEEVVAIRPGSFNQRIPLEWYVSVLNALRSAVKCSLQVTVATDDETGRVAEALGDDGTEIQVTTGGVLADLRAMCDADVLVSSISSLSMLAAFLSDKPYIWCLNQLTELDGWLAIWSDRSARTATEYYTRAETLFRASNARVTTNGFGRGTALASGDSIPEPLRAYLTLKSQLSRQDNDLIMYGRVRASVVAP